MQSFVYSVFVVVVSLIATLLAVGLSGILLLLAVDPGSSHTTTSEPAADRSGGRSVQGARGGLSFQN